MSRLKSNEGEIILELKGISKNFGAVKALQNVDFELYRNEILALVGDNGAGKSTLIKIITGVLKPDNGDIFFEGKRVQIDNVHDARDLGIETVFQDLVLAENIDIAGNIFISRELKKKLFGDIILTLNDKLMWQEAKHIMHKLKIKFKSTKTLVKDLSGGQRQAIAIGRAVYWNAKVLLMDEPTAALGVKEAAKVLELILQLKKEGLSIVIISHNLQQVFAVADRIVVLRGGKRVGSKVRSETSGDEIVKLIVGANLVKSEYPSLIHR
jgi:ABC-type sugar transport system ATPase subunit